MCGPSPCSKPNCTWGEKHRLECETREVLRWDRLTRLAYYADVKKKRGETAAQELTKNVREQWQKSQTLLGNDSNV